MPLPRFKDLRLPAGSVPAKWPVLLGIVLVSAIILSLLLSGDPVVVEVDPLAVDRPEVEPGEILPPAAPQIDRIDRQSRIARIRREEAEAEAAREADQARREAAEAARVNAAALARAQDRLAALRSRGVGGPAEAPAVAPDAATLVARTADEANLMETLRLEDLARQVQAVRAPPVVSSARGYGERTHQVRAVPPAQPVSSLPPAQPVPPSVQADPFPATVAPSLAQPPVAPLPASGQRPVPGRPSVPPIGGAGRFQGGAARPPLPAQGGAPPVTTFDAGPAAAFPDEPPGVIISPLDGDADRLYEGHLIPAVLQTQIAGDQPGPISAQVSRHVYSADRQRILIPRGTVALGSSAAVTDLWQGRLAVSFHRLVFPDGRWVRLEFTGLNSIGESSLKDQVDRHYLQLIGVGGAVGALAGFSRTGGDANSYGSAASEQLASTAAQIVSQFLNRLPTITVRAGHRLNIRLMTDLVVPRDMSLAVR